MALTRALLLVVCFSIWCQAESRTLALYAVPPKGLDAESTRVMQAELQRLLDPADLEIQWKTSRSGAEDFDLVAVGSFEGSCSSKEAVAEGSSILGDTSISNGHILPFFRVDCATIQRLLDRNADGAVLGRALARVIAHELYHIIANTSAHHDTGVAKAKFSTKDLTTPRFELDMWSVALMKPAPPSAGVSDSEASGR